MRGLVFRMVGVADKDAGEAIKSQLAIGFGVHNWRALRRRLQTSVVGLVIAQGVGHMAAQHHLLKNQLV